MTPELRRQCYWLMFLVTVAAMTGRVASAERFYEPSIYRASPDAPPEDNPPSRLWPAKRPLPMPTFGSNDRSRWATIRAIVEDGTFVIGHREFNADGTYTDTGRVFAPGYDSIDKVLDPKTNNFYSSKPPLLTVLLAGEYWVLRQLGFDLDTHRWLIVRLMVWTQNVLPIGLYLLFFIKVIERFGKTDWSRLFTYASACFGTFLTTFAITLNNHVPAAGVTFFAVYPLLMANGELKVRHVVISGLCAGLAMCFELPAAALAAGLMVYFLIGFGFSPLSPGGRGAGGEGAIQQHKIQNPKSKIKNAAAFLLAAALPVIAQLFLNYLAIGSAIPAYAKISKSGADNWYHYAGSAWLRQPGELKHGIDWAGDYESRGIYAFHLVVGHHGIFSLSPIWLLSFAAMLAATTRVVRRVAGFGCRFDHILALSFLISVVVIVFYVAVAPAVNYGGWTSGARWFFWLTPLWLLGVQKAVDVITECKSRLGHAFAYLCLFVSVFSVNYPSWNPWRHPWLFNWLEAYGWIPYGR